jgi:hypothetical protein
MYVATMIRRLEKGWCSGFLSAGVNAWAREKEQNGNPIPGRCPGLGERRTFGPGLAICTLAVVLACSTLMAADQPSGKQKKDGPKATTGSINITTNSAGEVSKWTATDVGGITLSGPLDVTGSVTITTTEPIPQTLDQTLSKAMENHPEVVTAKAKLRLAEAELNSKRMEVARKVADLWAERQKQLGILKMDEAEAKRTAELLKKGATSQMELDMSQRALIDEKAKLSRLESELRYLIRNSGPIVDQGSDSSKVLRQPQVPRGPMVEKIRQALATNSQLEFNKAPLGDVMDYLKGLHGIEVQLDTPAFEDEGIDTEGKKPNFWVTINLNKIQLGAVLQAVEDRYPMLKFVIRDYGILVTTPDRAKQQGYLPVADFWREVVAAGQATSGTTTFKEATPELRPVLTPKPR